MTKIKDACNFHIDIPTLNEVKFAPEFTHALDNLSKAMTIPDTEVSNRPTMQQCVVCTP